MEPRRRRQALYGLATLLLAIMALIAFRLQKEEDARKDDTDQGQEEPPISLEQMPGLLAALYCDAMEQCNPPVEVAARFRTANFRQSCRAESAARFRNETFAGMESAEKRTHFEYDPERAAACLSRLAQLECRLFDASLFEVCQDTFVGKSSRTCSHEYECVAGQRCDSSQSCPGFCTSKTTTGKPCESSLECEGGHFCSAISLTCESVREAGEECDSEDLSSQCEEGSFCNGTICAKNASLYLGTPGDTCSPTARCRAGLSCVSSSEGDRCVPRQETGKPCSLGFPSHCQDGTFCSAELADTGNQGACSPLLPEGTACTSSAQCADNRSCSRGRCLQRVAIGEKCSSDAECWTENCREGKCAERDPCAPSRHSRLR